MELLLYFIIIFNGDLEKLEIIVIGNERVIKVRLVDG